MKKIKKLDSKTAQSIMTFACPCVGNCDTSTCVNSCEGLTSKQASLKTGHSVLAQHGLQTANYN